MKIKDILKRNPEREITTVVKITEENPEIVWQEIDEYIPTEVTTKHFHDVLDVLLDTRKGVSERVCMWVSGFFGSGKTHFLKILAYLLENHHIKGPSGNTFSSQELIARKLGMESLLPSLKKEFKVKVLPINLLDYSRQDYSISRRVFQESLAYRGFSRLEWVAMWEKNFVENGMWDEFQNWVKENYQAPWNEWRKLHAYTTLREALQHFYPQLYKNPEDVEKAIIDSKERVESMRPSDVVRELVHYAQQIDPQKGRIVLLLDEVGLYIGDDNNKLTDLNAFAEKVVEEGGGKILLIVTSQEALPDIVTRFTSDRQNLEWLRSRFRLEFPLPPTEVSYVITKRLLDKKVEGREYLDGIFQKYEGNLRNSLIIESNWNKEEFVAHYPSAPYSIRLIQEIMGALRGSLEVARKLSGSERSLLKLVHAILTGEGKLPKGAEKEVGWLIPLDVFYDSLSKDLLTIRSNQVQAIYEIESLEPQFHLPLARVAKALFLLQTLGDRYPTTLETITSAIVDSIDTDFQRLREEVRKSLKTLQDKGWVIEENGQFRLLTREEYKLENDVRKNAPKPVELQSEAIEQLKVLLENFKFEYGQIRRALRVKLKIDDEQIFSSGDLEVVFYTPFSDMPIEKIEELSIQSPNTVFWKGKRNKELEDSLSRAIAIEKTLKKWSTRTMAPHETNYRNKIKNEAHNLLDVKIPSLMEESFLNGEILIGGKHIPPQTSNIKDNLKKILRDVSEQLYTEFIDKRPQKDIDCSRILSWSPGETLPDIYQKLELITPQGEINNESRVLNIVFSEIKKRDDIGEDSSGKVLIERFERPPYGWDQRLVRIAAATLFKSGRIYLIYRNQEITNPNDIHTKDIFTKSREFSTTIFKPLEEVDWREVSEQISAIFGTSGGDTHDETVKILREKIKEWIGYTERLITRFKDNRMPDVFTALAERFLHNLKQLDTQTIPSTIMKQFLDISGELNTQIRILQKFKDFSFEEYRKYKEFLRASNEWVKEHGGEVLKKWQELKKELESEDLPDYFQSIKDNFAYLYPLYKREYQRRHTEYQKTIDQIYDELRAHESFKHKSEEARSIIKSILKNKCDGEGTPDDLTFTCSLCHMAYSQLDKRILEFERSDLLEKLDNLIPADQVETPKPLMLEITARNHNDLEDLLGELKKYMSKTKRPVRIEIHAEPEREG